MKKKYLFLLTIVLCALSFSACSDNDDSGRKTDSADIKNETVNKWIYENMDFYYYWRDKMPAEKSMDYTISPDVFFDGLLASEDRFSWIQSSYVDLQNSLSGISSNEIGFDYMPYLLENNKSDVVFIVTYVKKGTKAESSNLKRGDVINKVNGVSLNTSNYSGALYANKSDYKLEGLNFSGVITVEPTAKYNENPIYIEKVITEGTTKIGYIVYNQFVMDNDDGTYVYDKQLADIFTKYNNENISYLVLDLRYNGGGYTSCATNIASALVPNRDTKKIFYYSQFNSVVDAYAKKEFSAKEYDTFINNYFKDNIEKTDSKGNVTILGAIPNYGNKLNKLYILAGKYTASASELVINGLLPFMKDKIVLIGETTYGKNVGSFTITDEDNKNNKWGMQPIVFKSFNQLNQSDYANGFTPGIQVQGTVVNEFSGILTNGLKALGDKDETLLAYAIADATGKPKSASLKSSSITIFGKSLKSEKNYRMIEKNSTLQRLIEKRANAQ